MKSKNTSDFIPISLKNDLKTLDGKDLMCPYLIVPPGSDYAHVYISYGGVAIIKEYNAIENRVAKYGRLDYNCEWHQIRDKAFRDVIKMYITTDGYCDMNLNQYVDAMLGKDFRKNYRITARYYGIVSDQSFYKSTTGV